MQLNDIRKEINNTQKTRVQQGFQSDMNFDSQVLETLNMNNGYLLIILRLMDEFTLLKVNGIGEQRNKNSPEYYYQLWEILDMIVNFITCKMRLDVKDDIKNRMNDLFDKVNTCFKQSEHGLYMNPIEARKLRKDLGQIFEDLLDNIKKQNDRT
jgi:hypothetical protein